MQTLCKSFLMSEEFEGSLGHNLEMKSESVSPGHVQDGQPGLTADNFPPKCLQKKNLFVFFIFWHFDAGALHSADFGDQGIYEVIQITCINFILQFSGLSGNLHITFNNLSLGDLRAPISCWWSFNLTAGRFYLHVCPLKLLA